MCILTTEPENFQRFSVINKDGIAATAVTDPFVKYEMADINKYWYRG